MSPCESETPPSAPASAAPAIAAFVSWVMSCAPRHSHRCLRDPAHGGRSRRCLHVHGDEDPDRHGGQGYRACVRPSPCRYRVRCPRRATLLVLPSRCCSLPAVRSTEQRRAPGATRRAAVRRRPSLAWSTATRSMCCSRCRHHDPVHRVDTPETVAPGQSIECYGPRRRISRRLDSRVGWSSSSTAI
jgi:hypothetical protein